MEGSAGSSPIDTTWSVYKLPSFSYFVWFMLGCLAHLALQIFLLSTRHFSDLSGIEEHNAGHFQANIVALAIISSLLGFWFSYLFAPFNMLSVEFSIITLLLNFTVLVLIVLIHENVAKYIYIINVIVACVCIGLVEMVGITTASDSGLPGNPVYRIVLFLGGHPVGYLVVLMVTSMIEFGWLGSYSETCGSVAIIYGLTGILGAITFGLPFVFFSINTLYGVKRGPYPELSINIVNSFIYYWESVRMLGYCINHLIMLLVVQGAEAFLNSTAIIMLSNPYPQFESIHCSLMMVITYTSFDLFGRMFAMGAKRMVEIVIERNKRMRIETAQAKRSTDQVISENEMDKNRTSRFNAKSNETELNEEEKDKNRTSRFEKENSTKRQKEETQEGNKHVNNQEDNTSHQIPTQEENQRNKDHQLGPQHQDQEKEQEQHRHEHLNNGSQRPTSQGGDSDNVATHMKNIVVPEGIDVNKYNINKKEKEEEEGTRTEGNAKQKTDQTKGASGEERGSKGDLEMMEEGTGQLKADKYIEEEEERELIKEKKIAALDVSVYIIWVLVGFRLVTGLYMMLERHYPTDYSLSQMNNLPALMIIPLLNVIIRGFVISYIYANVYDRVKVKYLEEIKVPVYPKKGEPRECRSARHNAQIIAALTSSALCVCEMVVFAFWTYVGFKYNRILYDSQNMLDETNTYPTDHISGTCCKFLWWMKMIGEMMWADLRNPFGVLPNSRT